MWKRKTPSEESIENLKKLIPIVTKNLVVKTLVPEEPQNITSAIDTAWLSPISAVVSVISTPVQRMTSAVMSSCMAVSSYSERLEQYRKSRSFNKTQ